MTTSEGPSRKHTIPPGSAKEEPPSESSGGQRQPNEPVEAGRNRNPLRVLRNRDYSRLFFAGVASSSGFAIGLVAFSYLVFIATRSAGDLAILGVSFTVASIAFSLFAGTLVDRQDRRMIMIVCDLVRSGSLAALAITVLVVGFNFVLLLALAFVLGAFTTIFQPAERALTPSLISSDEIADANGLVQTTNSISQFLASSAGGGLIVAIGVLGAIGANSLTFLISAILIAMIRAKKANGMSRANASESNKSSFLADTMEGLRYIGNNRGLLWMTVSAGIQNLFFAMVTNFFVVYVTDVLRGNAAVYGLFAGLFGLGLGPGGFAVGRTGAVKYAGKGILAAAAAECVIIAVLA